jgi:hypothetical protein
MIKYEFAIKIDILKNGEIIRIPVFRNRSGLSKFIPGPWNRIVKIYDKYIAMELDFIPKLTEQECAEHIEEYKKVLNKLKDAEVETVELKALETTEI